MTSGPSASRSAEWTGLPVSASGSVKCWRQRADGENAPFDAGGEELGGMALGDGEPLGLN